MYRSRRAMKTAFREGRGVYEDGQSSFSVNAQECRNRGRRALSQAIPIVRSVCSCSESAARRALLATHDGEWHHVSKYGNRVPYYDVQPAIDAILQLALFPGCCRVHALLDPLHPPA
jgi:hypothetical protein